MCICIVLIQGNEKSLMKFVAVSSKTLKGVECLPNILLNTDIIDLCLISCFGMLFKIRLESVTKVFMSEYFCQKLKFQRL